MSKESVYILGAVVAVAIVAVVVMRPRSGPERDDPPPPVEPRTSNGEPLPEQRVVRTARDTYELARQVYDDVQARRRAGTM